MKITKKQLYAGLGGLCILLIALLVFLLLPKREAPSDSGADASDASDVSDASSLVSEPSQAESHDEASSVSEETSSESSAEPEPEPEPYVSPIDFEAQWEQCEDIYAWLWIPGTDVCPGKGDDAPEINYPIAQSRTDDSFYLTHGLDGKEDRNGTLYTEHLHNGLDFSDPVTIIYGHNMRSGLRFGYLQEQFSDREWFEEHQEIYVYLPKQTLRYRVFAAVPYGKKHIMYTYDDFREPSSVTAFLESVYAVKRSGANFRADCEVTEEDHILVLSTCLPVSAEGRYLVLAKLEEVIGDVPTQEGSTE